MLYTVAELGVHLLRVRSQLPDASDHQGVDYLLPLVYEADIGGGRVHFDEPVRQHGNAVGELIGIRKDESRDPWEPGAGPVFEGQHTEEADELIHTNRVACCGYEPCGDLWLQFKRLPPVDRCVLDLSRDVPELRCGVGHESGECHVREESAVEGGAARVVKFEHAPHDAGPDAARGRSVRGCFLSCC